MQENRRGLWSMFCERCGSTNSENAAFCSSCGKALEVRDLHHGADAGTVAGMVSPNVVEDNGGLSWVYELSFWRNPAILITLVKVMLVSLGIVVLFTYILALADGVEDAGMFALTMLGIGAAIMTVLTVAAYIIVGLIYGGKYRVLFKMDRRGVNHIQLKKQYDRAAALGLLTAAAGLAGGNLTVAGAGLMGASRQSMYTAFSAVRSIKINERRNVIYLSETLSRNQVYAGEEDFPVVRDYILSHCPKNARHK